MISDPVRHHDITFFVFYQLKFSNRIRTLSFEFFKKNETLYPKKLQKTFPEPNGRQEIRLFCKKNIMGYWIFFFFDAEFRSRDLRKYSKACFRLAR